MVGKKTLHVLLESFFFHLNWTFFIKIFLFVNAKNEISISWFCLTTQILFDIFLLSYIVMEVSTAMKRQTSSTNNSSWLWKATWRSWANLHANYWRKSIYDRRLEDPIKNHFFFLATEIGLNVLKELYNLNFLLMQNAEKKLPKKAIR